MVAGLSGCGKSEFIRHMTLGGLPADISRCLPADIQTWPHLDESDPERTFRELREGIFPALPGLVMPYDLARSFWAGQKGYDWDDAVKIIGFADRVTVVNIRPPLRRLIEQHIWRRFGVTLADGQSDLKNFRSNSRGLQLLIHYEQPGWVDLQYDVWDDLLRCASELHEILVLGVTPESIPGGQEFRWSLKDLP